MTLSPLGVTESLSETGKTTVGRELMTLDVSPQFTAYSGVEIIVDDDTSYFAGNRSGRVLTIHNEWGTQAQASAILNSLQTRGFQYQPYKATGVMLNPAAVIGDGISMSDVYSGIYKVSRKYSHLASSDLEAPEDEEIDHEFPYEPKQDRVYSREIAEAKSQISITASQIQSEVSRATAAEGALSSRITQTNNSITAEVTRATAAEGTLSSRITQTSNSITAEVSRATNAENTLRSSITVNATSIAAKVSKSGGNAASFGWNLTDSQWTLTSSNSTVLKVTSSGIEVSGKVTAKSGYIGNGSSGFTISSTAIYNGMTSLTDTTHNGVYIGTNGIALGKGTFRVTSAGAVTATNLTINGGSINLGNGAFKVTTSGAVTASNLTITGGSIRLGSNFSVNSSGNVTANNMTLTGTLTVGGAQITADALRAGAQSAYTNGSAWSNASDWVGSNGSYCYGGAGGGYLANDAFNNNATVTYLKARNITATAGYITVGDAGASWQSKTFITGVHVNWVQQRAWTTQATIYYLGRNA